MTMLTPSVIDADVVKEIARVGELRRPNEACGVLLPFPWRGQRVWEMPNRSKQPHDTFEMSSEDIVITLEDWVNEFPEEAHWDRIAVWHTHPDGQVGPSRTDLDNRIEHCGNLVVTLLVDGATATWF